mmetsp:Transcript_48102/g.80854  ORF Transcript_48102/g.80854 Transcript_48102/m.80854 type:complete len:238 (+) Transcript_48102:604-1317(+)
MECAKSWASLLLMDCCSPGSPPWPVAGPWAASKDAAVQCLRSAAESVALPVRLLRAPCSGPRIGSGATACGLYCSGSRSRDAFFSGAGVLLGGGGTAAFLPANSSAVYFFSSSCACWNCWLKPMASMSRLNSALLGRSLGVFRSLRLMLSPSRSVTPPAGCMSSTIGPRWSSGCKNVPGGILGSRFFLGLSFLKWVYWLFLRGASLGGSSAPSSSPSTRTRTSMPRFGNRFTSTFLI